MRDVRFNYVYVGSFVIYMYICFNNLTAPIGHCTKVIMNELGVVPAAGFDQIESLVGSLGSNRIGSDLFHCYMEYGNSLVMGFI